MVAVTIHHWLLCTEVERVATTVTTRALAEEQSWLHEHHPEEDLLAAGLSARTRSALYGAGIYSLAQIARRTEKELLAITNFGPVCLTEVLRFVRPADDLVASQRRYAKALEVVEAARPFALNPQSWTVERLDTLVAALAAFDELLRWARDD